MPSIDRAIAALELERFEDARREAAAAVSRSSDDPTARYVLARALLGLDRLDEAEPLAASLIAEEPDRTDWLYLLGRIRRARGGRDDLRSAEALFRRAMTLRPDEAESALGLADCYIARGAFRQAVALLHQQLARHPDDPFIHQQLSRAQLLAGDGHGAAASAQVSLYDQPDDATTHLLKGVACYRKSEYHAAEKHLREALRLDPSNTDVGGVLVDACRRQNGVYRALAGVLGAFGSIPGALRWPLVLVLVLTGMIGLVIFPLLLLLIVRWLLNRRLRRDPILASVMN